ncbi:MAG: hypothetical protein QM796_09735 [Chthoniobacteraceae bacterium]
MVRLSLSSILLTLATLSVVPLVQAGTPDKTIVAPPSDLFHPGEWQVDIYGNAATGNIDYHTTQTTSTTTSTEVVSAPTVVTTYVSVPNPTPTPTPQTGARIPRAAKGGTHLVAVQHVVTETSTVTEKHTNREISTDYDHTDYGAGVGVNYFVTRNLGASLEADWLNGHSDIGAGSINAIYRFPWENETHSLGLAPYVYVGAGGQFDGVSAAFGQVGGGVELRFAQHWGTFVDGRYVLHDSNLNYGLFRAGVRINF